ncbi:EF-P beta-lysylation protein EpmB [Fontimonas sp. SYSU GA230001]|uniref:EF-P beta-lysylation protein EpmB n=1 Tax=Fontimonas sp. SYSU GA230001 TaxID=3142450 RepID=UPI0032B330FE
MIALPQPLRQQAPQWQHALREAFTRPDELLRFLDLDASLPMLALERVRDFPLRVPRGYAQRMRKGDPRDPLFLQVWPRPQEADAAPGFGIDAVGDLRKARGGGLIHKYRGRVLVIATGACAVHCRYCFRRHFPYNEHLGARDHWREALHTIASDASITEVILSGGDPLSLADDKLAEFADALDRIPHLRRLRLHTRQPVVLPERVDERLLDWLGRGRLAKVIVLHVNHAHELDHGVAAALRPLRALGLTLLNQSVLLRGINDDVATLQQLSERLSECGILPYYLHLLDRVQGTAHFEVDEDRACALMQGLAARLPGYLVPKLVREESGALSKTTIAWQPPRNI